MWWQIAALAYLASKYQASKTTPPAPLPSTAGQYLIGNFKPPPNLTGEAMYIPPDNKLILRPIIPSPPENSLPPWGIGGPITDGTPNAIFRLLQTGATDTSPSGGGTPSSGSPAGGGGGSGSASSDPYPTTSLTGNRIATLQG